MADRYIELTRGQVAVIDEADFDLVSRYKWHAHKVEGGFYARAERQVAGKRTRIYMHRLITGAKEGETVDHEDLDKLNNRRDNLRVCDDSQNQANRNGWGEGSKYKGVSWHKQREKWQAKICLKRKQIHIGVFDLEIEAAKMYDEAAKKHFGDFAVLNFPNGIVAEVEDEIPF